MVSIDPNWFGVAHLLLIDVDLTFCWMSTIPSDCECRGIFCILQILRNDNSLNLLTQNLSPDCYVVSEEPQNRKINYNQCKCNNNITVLILSSNSYIEYYYAIKDSFISLQYEANDRVLNGEILWHSFWSSLENYPIL